MITHLAFYPAPQTALLSETQSTTSMAGIFSPQATAWASALRALRALRQVSEHLPVGNTATLTWAVKETTSRRRKFQTHGDTRTGTGHHVSSTNSRFASALNVLIIVAT
jgi:hypothetical protein